MALTFDDFRTGLIRFETVSWRKVIEDNDVLLTAVHGNQIS